MREKERERERKRESLEKNGVVLYWNRRYRYT